MGFILVQFTPQQLEQVRNLSTTEGFCQAFEQNLQDFPTFTEAYEFTESQHEQLFGKRKYSGYVSFSTCRKKV